MKTKIELKDLHCYQNASQIEREKLPGVLSHYVYDLSLLATSGMRKELRRFIYHRGEVLRLSSVRSEYTTVMLFCQFLYKSEVKVKSFLEWDIDVWEKKLKAWLLENNYKISSSHYKKAEDKIRVGKPMVVAFVRKLLLFLEPEPSILLEQEKDIWTLEKLPIPVRQNPITPVKHLYFTQIKQPIIRAETKQACYLHCQYFAVSTVGMELTAMRRFSAFLAENAAQVKSLGDLNRQHIEAYLLYIHTSVKDKNNFHSELTHLNTLIKEVGRIIGNQDLFYLFLARDIPKSRKILFRAYSDAEVARLNTQIIKMEEQLARALIIHQMLGTRISDTLSLRMDDCLYKEGNQYRIRIYQVKNGVFEKPISSEVAELILKSIEYTRKHYGDTFYIFVNDRDSTRPFSYGAIRDRVLVMIRECDLRDDNGELFSFESHMFRHCYGQKLTEMHLDDEVIAKLLGHRTMQAVHCYRKLSNQTLAKETKQMRNVMDNILDELVKEWDRYE